MTAVRPKSFLSSIQISFGTYLYRKFGSKHLVNLCHQMGFSCSYTEAMRFESSAILRKQELQIIEKGAFVQFVWDNADVNVKTIDGENTFHEMGGIMIITPHTSFLPDKSIPRLKYVPADSLISSTNSELKHSTMKKNAGLSAISIADVKINEDIIPTAPDLLWLYGKSTNLPDIPGWNGFMEQVTKECPYKQSKIVFLPFIHAPPTQYDTVLTSLLEASERSSAHGQKTCIVTYDQPLYLKARDIVENSKHPQLNSVVVRLGGFHLLMSFMGAIGAIMAGSGLKELLTTIYAENSVDRILNGHAYSRAVRAHILTNYALVSLIVNNEIEFTEEEHQEIEKLLLCERSVILRAADNETVQFLSSKFKTAMDQLEQRSPTSKLWIQYYKMTTLMKQFIQAERMGDWELHLETIKSMLPFFHSAGHFLYAKSARLYVQDMDGLRQKMDPMEFNLFTEGYFTIRRSHKFWSGLWTDLTIEQVLMRSMKSQGGLTHGRGISNSVLARWTEGMVYMLNICEGHEIFWNVSCTTTEQHTDMRPARIERDSKDAEKLKSWLNVRTPFPFNEKILSICSGVVGGAEVNCHMAQEIGCKRVKEITGKEFGNVKFKRKDKVRGLATATVKVHNKQVVIDPLTIFQRLCITKQSDTDLKNHFTYELAPYPMALFSEEGMRKGNKSSFYSAFAPLPENVAIGERTFVVVDGGYLLHKVVWRRNSSVMEIIATYITYTCNHFGKNISVVFDGYPEEGANKSTKTAERARRYAASTCSDIVFEESTQIKVPQEKFLSNPKNKQRLIVFICTGLGLQGIETKQAPEDADCLIVRTALEKSEDYQHVIIVGEDVDLLVLLNGLGASRQNVLLQKSDRSGTGCKQFTATSFIRGDLSLPPGIELFLHAFSGCDTTSAIFGQGKTKLLSVLSKQPDLLDAATTFLNNNATPEEIASAGNKYFVALYGGGKDDSLHALRYGIFVRSAASAKANLARLPPTEEAAAQHSYRTYHQVQQWLGVEKDPTEWGWTRSQEGLTAVASTKEPAPQTLLKLLLCR